MTRSRASIIFEALARLSREGVEKCAELVRSPAFRSRLGNPRPGQVEVPFQFLPTKMLSRLRIPNRHVDGCHGLEPVVLQLRSSSTSIQNQIPPGFSRWLKIGHSAKLFSATPEELNVCRTEATRRRTPAGCYVPVLTSASRGHIAPLRGATLRRTFSTNIAHLRCATHRVAVQ